MIRKFFALTLIVFTAITISGPAHAAVPNDDAFPILIDCHILRYDPATTVHTTVEVRVDGQITTQNTTDTPDANHYVHVDVSSLVNGRKGEYRAFQTEFPEQYRYLIAWHPFDCRPPGVAVTVTCTGFDTTWDNLHTPLTVNVTYQGVTDTRTFNPDEFVGQTANAWHPITVDQTVAIHATWDGGRYDAEQDVGGCSTPPPPPTTAPPVPVTTPVIATGPGKPGELATTGAGTDMIAIVGVLLFAGGCAFLYAGSFKRRVR